MKLQKTALGQSAFKKRSPRMGTRHRVVFILVDGTRTVHDVLQGTQGVGVTAADLDYLLQKGFLAPVPTNCASALQRPEYERFRAGRKLAVRLMYSLGARGILLSGAVESTRNYQDLLALLPRIQAAIDPAAAQKLERVLKN